MTHLFIINPSSGNSFLSDHLREELCNSEILKDQEVLVFNSEYPEHETVLVKQVMKFLPEEEFRIYVCGGSGSFHHVLNAIHDFCRVKITHFACGFSNDNLKIFGRNYSSSFTKIEKLLCATPVALDYIKTSNGNSFNTISCGYSSDIIRIHRKFFMISMLSSNLSWFISGFLGLLFSKAQSYEVQIDGKDFSGKYHEIICANGKIQGGALYLGDDIAPDDGILNFLMIPQMKKLDLIKTALCFYLHNSKFFNKRVLRYTGRSFFIVRKDRTRFNLDIDGELASVADIEASIVPGGLPFLMPEGAEIYRGKKKEAHHVKTK